NGDQQLAQQLEALLRQLGIEGQADIKLSEGQSSALHRLFFSIDPDNEINRNNSPFMFAS
ncbi:MAG: hypothetical protein RJB13_2072, partial [Pseudomonadota bacterium]